MDLGLSWLSMMMFYSGMEGANLRVIVKGSSEVMFSSARVYELK